MKYKLQLAMLYIILGIFLLFAAGSVFLLLSQPKETTREEAGFDYEAVQEMVEPAPPVEQEKGPQPPVYDADELRAINPDFHGWLMIPDTTVNFPVVLGSNNSYYLKHTFTKNYSQFGCLFLSSGTQDTDRNRVIHGHNMGNNREEMFSPLVNYQDQAFAEEHATIFYSEPDKAGEETYTVFAVLNFNINKMEEFNYMQQVFEEEGQFEQFVSYLKEHSIYETDYVPTGDTLILSTCNRMYGKDNRLLICAGREPKSEEISFVVTQSN